MKFEVPPLPYSKDALAPAMSQETLEFHYEKHHKGYMNKLKAALEGKPEAQKTLEEVIKSSSGGVFNNAAQVWNHTFFWEGMKAGGGGAPPAGDVADLINRDFGGWDQFRAQWHKDGAGRFGSGYVWLVLDGGKGKILTTPNAETPLTTPATPLLTTDVWEHAYYLDHRNARAKFLEVFTDKLINWDNVAKNLKAAK
jgi:Fe-Mn family superoxide dismutase